MQICIIVNPEAGSAGKNDEIVAWASRQEDIRVLLTEGPGHAQRLARQACVDGAQRVIAAGGDGTVNEVLNGMAGHFDRATLGVLPLGTGNDAARALGMPDGPEEALRYLVDTDRVGAVDIMRVSNPGTSRLALNHINAGYSNLVSEQVSAEMKQRWGPFAYLKSAASQLRERTEYHTRISWDGGDFEVIDAVNVLIANGPTVAGGLRIAPGATLEDGQALVIVFRAGSLVDLAEVAARALLGRMLDSDSVIARPARRIHIESTPPMVFNADGEVFCESTVDMRVLPARLRAILGPHYAGDPADDGRAGSELSRRAR